MNTNTRIDNKQIWTHGFGGPSIPTQRAKVNKKWAEIAEERANVTDSVAGVELIERLNGWEP